MPKSLRAELVFVVMALASISAVAQPLPELKPTVAFPNLTFTRPVYVGALPDGSGRMVVLEQYTGLVKMFPGVPDATSAATILNLGPRLRASLGTEEGLLGLAFHPQFAGNGEFFVYYIAPPTVQGMRSDSIVARFHFTSATTVDPIPEVVMRLSQPEANHNGGCLQFGPDGMLYLGLGDGGGGGDTFSNGQNLGTPLAAILRVDVDHTDPGKNYAVPPDNPFVGTTGAAPEIWAWGLRNPWRFSFDSLTGTLWVGDVGQSTYEEIDIIEKGKNYGWNIMEASHCYPPGTTCNPTGLTYPVWEYGRTEGQSVTGGAVYRGRRLPELYGWYVFADYVQGRVWALKYQNGLVVNHQLLVDLPVTVSSFGEDEDHELYFVSLDSGRVYQLDYVTPPTPTPTPTVPAPLVPDFNMDGQVDAEDLLLLLEGFHGSSTPLDLDSDGIVGGRDVLAFSVWWKITVPTR